MSLETIVFNDLGKLSYASAWEIQKDLFEKRLKSQIPDTLLFAEHDPTITFGINNKWNILHTNQEDLSNRGIAFHRSKRGGGAAYLGPGQLIGYTIMDIKPFGGVLNFMKMLEEVMIRTANNFDIKIGRYDVQNPTSQKPYRATWYRNGRDYVLCTKGIGLQFNGSGLYTHHGFCLNVNKNDSYYSLIDPCGFPVSEVQPISIGEIKGNMIDMIDVKDAVRNNFLEVFTDHAPN